MPTRRQIESALARPTPDRLLVAAEALRQGFTVERINADRRLRPVVPRAAAGNRRRRGAGSRRAGCRSDAAGMRRLEGDGLLRRAAGAAGAALGPCAAGDERGERARLGRGPRCAEGDDRRGDRGRGARAPAEARRAAGVQADRQLRRRVRCRDALSLLDLSKRRCSARPRTRPRSATQAQGDDPRRRAQPDRAGDRVRLLLLPRRLRAARGGARRRSWSIATRRRCRPTPTPRTGSISSR